jgi:6-pyruvoyltetrahydropterin/6-carboxytetrahydropterin synthase
MFHVTREFDFCYGHRLLDYDGKCAHLHGHNGRALVTLAADKLDSKGMVLDFSDMKKKIDNWIETNIDHRMILCKDDPAVETLQALGEPIFLIDENPTAENMARLLFDFAKNEGLPVTEVSLWETPRCHATYNETGIK